MYLQNKMATKEEFSKYERARIIGARGLQVSMDAPLLLNLKEEELEGVNYDPLKIAEKELDSGVLPISVNRPLPGSREEELHRIKVEDSTLSDEEKEKAEQEEEQDIAKSGEMMELTNTEEDFEEEPMGGESGSSEE